MKLSAALILASGAVASVIGRVHPSEENVAAVLDAEVNVDDAPSARRVPTSAESAVLARRLLALTPFGTISTVYPDDSEKDTNAHALENRPTGLGGVPVGLPEYLADCEGDSGNPTLLALTIATTFRNVAAGSNISLSLQWNPPHEPAPRLSVLEKAQKMVGWRAHDNDVHSQEEPRSARSVADLPRFSLLGYLETITGQEAPTSPLAFCFVKAHPDARWWLPGNVIHQSYWTRLVVTQVYWIGGFGDRNYIGWIPIEEWRNVTRQDWEKVRLPGERKGWNTEYDL